MELKGQEAEGLVLLAARAGYGIKAMEGALNRAGEQIAAQADEIADLKRQLALRDLVEEEQA